MKTLIEKQLTQMNRYYVQFAASMPMSGSVENAVGVESLVSQTVNRSGLHVVSSPRVGMEVPIFRTWLKARGGSYLEPTRFENSDMRVHGTFGLDSKLAVWNVFGLWPDNTCGASAPVAMWLATTSPGVSPSPAGIRGTTSRTRFRTSRPRSKLRIRIPS